MQKNIVLIVVDTLRAKNLECYGYEKETAPFLNKMAEEHTKIDRFYANAPWTVPSHASLFTGDFPSVHGCTTEHLRFDLENSLVESLKQQEYTAYGISENSLVSEQLGFDVGFDEFHSLSGGKEGEVWNEIQNRDAAFDSTVKKWSVFLYHAFRRRDIPSLHSFYRRIREKVLFRRVGEDIHPQGSRHTLNKITSVFQKEDTPFFLFVNLMPVHAPYTFNEEQREQFLPEIPDEAVTRFANMATVLEDLDADDYSPEEVLEIRESAYDASIRYTDTLLQELWEDAPDDTVVIVIGDHGELIGEYEVAGWTPVDHHFGTFKELVHVPCLIFPDNDIEIPDGVHDLCSLHHLIQNIAGAEGEGTRSEYAIAEYSGKAAMNRHFNRSIPEEREELFSRTSRSIITKNWKYDITSDGEYLWAVEAMTEKDNNIVEQQETVKHLRSLLQYAQRQADTVDDIDI